MHLGCALAGARQIRYHHLDLEHLQALLEKHEHEDRPRIILSESVFGMRTAARQWELPIWKNECPSSGATRRTEIHDWLQLEMGRDKRIRNNVFNALTRYQMERQIVVPVPPRRGGKTD